MTKTEKVRVSYAVERVRGSLEKNVRPLSPAGYKAALEELCDEIEARLQAVAEGDCDEAE